MAKPITDTSIPIYFPSFIFLLSSLPSSSDLHLVYCVSSNLNVIQEIYLPMGSVPFGVGETALLAKLTFGTFLSFMDTCSLLFECGLS